MCNPTGAIFGLLFFSMEMLFVTACRAHPLKRCGDPYHRMGQIITMLCCIIHFFLKIKKASDTMSEKLVTDELYEHRIRRKK